jgi:hypothetical protein
MLTLRPINGERRSAAIRQQTSDLVTIREQARAAIATLQTIRDDGNVTNAEAVAYIKDEARVTQGLIRFVVGQLT